MISDDEAGCVGRGEEFLQIFKKGAEFSQELLKENERLRYRLFQLEQGQAVLAGDQVLKAENERLMARVRELEQEKDDILRRIRLIEEENQDFANRYVEIEAENNNLANLYIASYQLHSTLDFHEVLQIITEIVINLIGAEEFAVMLFDEKNDRLEAVTSEGVDCAELPVVEPGVGVIGSALQSGESYFVPDMEGYTTKLDQPMVCIPLKIKDHVIGTLVIYKLLIHKKCFAQVDYELFTLLAGHAATALFSSKLYSDSERKLSTIQGFLDLLTKK
jgi:hypothetical protein